MRRVDNGWTDIGRQRHSREGGLGGGAVYAGSHTTSCPKSRLVVRLALVFGNGCRLFPLSLSLFFNTV